VVYIFSKEVSVKHQLVITYLELIWILAVGLVTLYLDGIDFIVIGTLHGFQLTTNGSMSLEIGLIVNVSESDHFSLINLMY